MGVEWVLGTKRFLKPMGVEWVYLMGVTFLTIKLTEFFIVDYKYI